jgi:hypothetical protein
LIGGAAFSSRPRQTAHSEFMDYVALGTTVWVPNWSSMAVTCGVSSGDCRA